MPSIKPLKKVAFLSMDTLDDFESYDALLESPMLQLGWKTDTLSWRDESVDWNQFDAVLIRSTWDYQDDPELFLQVLHRIDQSTAQLANCLKLVEWNIKKTYLQDLQQQGFSIVPSFWGQALNKTDLTAYFQLLHTDEIIIKPDISANADNTFRLDETQAKAQADDLELTFAERDFIVQPFMQSIIDEGEYSLFFFGSDYSHTILKKPAVNDFRVQEEHGGTLMKVEPDAELIAVAEKLNLAIKPAPLYSRLDFVRSESGFAIMEVELIEPSLYFNMDDQSAIRFVRAFENWMSEL